MKKQELRPETTVDFLPFGLRVAQGIDRPRPDKRAPLAEPSASKAAEAHVPSAVVGGDDAFILAWGRNNEALAGRTRQLALSMVLNCVMAGLVGVLVYLNATKEPLVFVRDALGNVVQGNAEAFLQAGRDRSEVEVKGFVREWIVDAWTWTPLDVQDRLAAALAVVDGKAHGVVKDALDLGARQLLVESGISGRIDDGPRAKRPPVGNILRRSPLEVRVTVDRYLIDKSGGRTDAGPLTVTVVLQEIPRTPENPFGLLVTDLQLSDRM